MNMQTNSPTYQVRAGDTLYAIARQHRVPPAALIAMNPYINPLHLRAGDTLNLPGNTAGRPSRASRAAGSPGRPVGSPGRPIGSPGRPLGGPGRPATVPGAASYRSLHDQMRMLWEQHVWWTRELIVSIVEGLPDQAAVTNRLLKNPAQLAALFRPAFGAEAEQAITRLFTGHLTIGAELIEATKAGDAAAIDDANRRWYLNADALAAEFASLGPQFRRDEMRQMLYTHLDLIKQQVDAQLAGNYEQSIAIFDEFEWQALMMADQFSRGIARARPRRG